MRALPSFYSGLRLPQWLAKIMLIAVAMNLAGSAMPRDIGCLENGTGGGSCCCLANGCLRCGYRPLSGNRLFRRSCGREFTGRESNGCLAGNQLRG